jgi:hypothetical protein
MTITISSGVTSSGLHVTRDDVLVVDSGGVASASVIAGTEIVSAGGLSDRDILHSNGVETVLGSASGTIVRTASTLQIGSGGVVLGAKVGGLTLPGMYGEILVEGGTLSSAVLSSGGALFLGIHGTAKSVIVEGGAEIAFYHGGGVLESAFIRSGGYVSISSTRSIDARISSGGDQVIQGRGIASGGAVLAGGRESIEITGSSIGQTVVSGGAMEVEPGSVVSDVTLRSGADIIFDLQSATAQLSGGAIELFNSGGQVIETIGLAGGGAGLAISTSVISSGGYYQSGSLDIYIVSSGGSGAVGGRLGLFNQAIAGFGDAGAVGATSSAVHNGGISSPLVDLLKPH